MRNEIILPTIVEKNQNTHSTISGCLFLAFAYMKPVSADGGGEDDPPKAYNDLIAMDSTPPANYKNDLEPYGHGKDVAFHLVQMDELMVYRYFGDKKDHTVTAYDTLKAKNTENPLKDPAKTKDFTVSLGSILSFTQTVGFDPTGSGRKDHIAVLGVTEQNDGQPHVNLYVMDKNGRTSKSWDIGRAKWMSNYGWPNSDDIWDFNAMNFLSITAGDYNGDKKESLVVYACCDNPTLATFDANVTDSGISLSCQNPDGRLMHYMFTNLPNEYIGNRLHCALDSGDLDGDGITDLAVLSYVGRMTRADDGRKQKTQFYLPCLVASYGQKDSADPITAGTKKSRSVCIVDTNDGDNHVCPMGAGLDVGDVNGDGFAEITVAGFYHNVEGTYDKQVDDPYDKLDSGNLVVGIYNQNLDTLFYKTDIASNKWTRGGDVNGGLWVNGASSDDSFQQTAVESIALNGKKAAKHLFINGDLYTFDPQKTSLDCVYQPDFFQHADLGTGENANAETYFRDTAVGVFDGNEDGHEQLVYVLGSASTNQSGWVTYLMGMVGGVYEKDGKTSNKVLDYYSTSSDDIENSYYPDANGAKCRYNSYFTFSLCPWDCDYDGLHVKYTSKDYAYSDPDVMAILQAPPFFDDVKKVAGDSETYYTITTNYEFSKTDSDSFSWGIGAALDVTAAVVKVSIDSSYIQDWTDSFTNSWTKEFERKVKTHEEDQVVLSRTPVTMYHYQVEKDGVWSDDNTLSLSFPGEPSLVFMNIPDYNFLVDYYNTQNEKKANEINQTAGKTVIEDKDIPRLSHLEDSYLCNEGNPFSYMSSDDRRPGLKVLQDTSLPFGVGSSGTEFSWSESHSSTSASSVSRGFDFNYSCMVGGGDPAVFECFGGVKVSLEYMSEHSTESSEGNGMGSGCSINNMSREKLKDAGISEDTANLYGFRYQMVAWPSNITNSGKYSAGDDDEPAWFVDFGDEKHKYAPIYGYMLSGVTAGPPRVTDLTTRLDKDDKGNPAIRLSWSDPSDKNRKAGAYVLYRIVTDKATGEQVLKKITSLPANTKDYLFTDLGTDLEFRFVIRTQEKESGPEGIDSNHTYLYIGDGGSYLVSLTTSDEENDTYLLTLSDGRKSTFTVTHGLMIDNIDLNDASTDNKGTVTYTIKFSDGSKQTVIIKGNQQESEDPNQGSSDKNPQEEKNKAAINITSLKLASGKTAQLKVSGKNVTKWTTSNKSVAIVKGGKVTALKKGTATIRAVLKDGSSLTCKITVTTSPVLKTGGKKLKKNKRYMVKKGKTLTVTITGKAKGIKNVYSSSNKKTARVISKKTAKKLKIKGFKKGKATIKIKVNGITHKIKIQVK